MIWAIQLACFQTYAFYVTLDVGYRLIVIALAVNFIVNFGGGRLV